MKKKTSENILVGGSLHYPVSVMVKYKKKLRSLVDRMTSECNRKILKLFDSDTAEEFQENFAMDESISSQSRILLNKLSRRFTKLFDEQSKGLAESVVKGANTASVSNVKTSLKKVSEKLTINSRLVTPAMREIGKAAIAENIALIKSIPQQYMTQIQGSVMRSISAGGDLQALSKTLRQYEGITERRVKIIAEDQVRKAYGSITAERMKSIDSQFKWNHSGGGQHVRPSHVAMDGNIYSFDDLPIINADNKNAAPERGIPGQAPNCKCFMTLVINLNRDED